MTRKRPFPIPGLPWCANFKWPTVKIRQALETLLTWWTRRFQVPCQDKPGTCLISCQRCTHHAVCTILSRVVSIFCYAVCTVLSRVVSIFCYATCMVMSQVCLSPVGSQVRLFDVGSLGISEVVFRPLWGASITGHWYCHYRRLLASGQNVGDEAKCQVSQNFLQLLRSEWSWRS